MLASSLIVISALIAAVLLIAASRRLLLSYAAAFLYRTAAASDHSPTIWVVCAGRNEERRLPRLTDSLASLRYRGRRKFVLIDDWSTDGSPALMAATRDRHPDDFEIVLLSGRQRGKADALRDGLAQVAIGRDDIILVIDADHRLRPDALDNLANYFTDPLVSAVAIEHPVDMPARAVVAAYCYLEAAVGEVVTSRGQHALGLSTKLAGSWAAGGDLGPMVLFGAVIAFYIAVISIQILTALRLSGAGFRLAWMSFASLPMLAVDILISIRGILTGMLKRRVAWTTDHRG